MQKLLKSSLAKPFINGSWSFLRKANLNRRPIMASSVPRTVVILSSISFPKENLKSISGVEHYEKRALWEIFWAVNSNVNVIFVSSLPVSKIWVEHLANLHPLGDKFLERVKFISLNDASNDKCLSEKLLANKSVQKEIKKLCCGRYGILSTFVTSTNERKLAKELKLPIWGGQDFDPYLISKSGNKKIFKEANIQYAAGENDLTSELELVEFLLKSNFENGSHKKYMIKLNAGVSGTGNAIFEIDKELQEDFSKKSKTEQEKIIAHSLKNLKYQGTGVTWSTFSKEFSKGFIVEEFIDGHSITSPSAQGVIHSNGKVSVLATHEQILDEDGGGTFLGAKFPANEDYRQEIQNMTFKIGQILKEHNVKGVFGVDFLVTVQDGKQEVYAIEINLRKGGTTHPYQTTRFLTKSKFDKKTGLLKNSLGQSFVYQSNDNLQHENLVGLSAVDFLEYMTSRNVIFDKTSSEGVVFHMLDTLESHGKLGCTIIATSEKKVALYESLVNKYISELCYQGRLDSAKIK